MLSFDKPLLVAVVSARSLAPDLKAVEKAEPDVIEFRADLQDTVNAGTLLAQLEEIKERSSLPVLFTLRDVCEGGEFGGEDGEREMLYRAILPYVDAIDIEAVNLDVYGELRQEIRHRSITSILSYHNFKTTPDTTDLDKIIAFTGTVAPDIIKIATVCKTSYDALRLLSLPEKHPEQAMAIIGMGELGRTVRVVAPAFKSVLGYASLNTAVAPGQLSVEELRTAWHLAGIPHRTRDRERNRDNNKELL
jgi:3-dehydroquinate dehydratase-1